MITDGDAWLGARTLRPIVRFYLEGIAAHLREGELADIAEFLMGFERFREKYFAGDGSLFARLRQGQTPHALVISCCDSRADPGMLMGAGPGDIFVVRNVANLVPPYRNGAEMPGIRADIEFAVKGLNVERIIILGHWGCGGIRALIDGEGVTEHNFEFIGAWVSIARPVRERVLREFAGQPVEVQARACEKGAIALSLENLMTFPWIRERVEAGTLTLHGWYFDIDAGELLAYSPETKSFEPLLGKPAVASADRNPARG
jgi:carbonic anhydrase